LETVGGGISAPSGGANPWAARAAEVACPACASREGLTPDPHTPLEEFAPDQHEPPNKTIAGAEGGGWRESRAALDVRVGRLRHKDAGLRVIVLNGWRTDTVGRLPWALFIFSYISFWPLFFFFSFFSTSHGWKMYSTGLSKSFDILWDGCRAKIYCLYICVIVLPSLTITVIIC
jgi:hypothetical protein